jgi:peptidoglycan/LPS O-acetylase OafA/YrhL
LPDALVLAVLWSVAVEEQFYLVWPVVLKFSNRKIYPVIFSIIILFTMIFRSFYTADTVHNFAVRNFDTFSVIGDMALGGMMAYYCSYENALFKYIRTMPRWQIALVYVLTITLILFKRSLYPFPVFMVTERLWFAILFALIIAEQNFAENSLFKFSKFKRMSILGTYTYGLYCLHSIAISGIVFLSQKYGWEDGTLLAGLTACIFALLISIGISWLSYHFFEKHFLKLKNKFAFIVKN